jgi:hypothetical protein
MQGILLVKTKVEDFITGSSLVGSVPALNGHPNLQIGDDHTQAAGTCNATP